jgi:pimeloyl-ACP methyl ester carboxylesterase
MTALCLMIPTVRQPLTQQRSSGQCSPRRTGGSGNSAIGRSGGNQASRYRFRRRVARCFRRHRSGEQSADGALPSLRLHPAWTYDLDATIDAMHLDQPILIGWSAGAWAAPSFFNRRCAVAENGCDLAVGFALGNPKQCFGDTRG